MIKQQILYQSEKKCKTDWETVMCTRWNVTTKILALSLAD